MIANRNIMKNIRHIQIKKIAYSPNLFKAIIIYEEQPNRFDESDDLEYIKYLEHQKDNCPPCEEMERKRRSIDNWER